MKYVKNFILFFLFLIFIYFFLKIFLIQIYFYYFNKIRKTNNIVLVNKDFYRKKDFNTFYFISKDTNNSVFYYKIIEIKKIFFNIPLMTGEMDVFYNKLNNQKLKYLYFWEYKLNNIKIKNSFIEYEFFSDSTELPNHSYVKIERNIYLNRTKADSILKNWLMINRKSSNNIFKDSIFHLMQDF